MFLAFSDWITLTQTAKLQTSVRLVTIYLVGFLGLPMTNT